MDVLLAPMPARQIVFACKQMRKGSPTHLSIRQSVFTEIFGDKFVPLSDFVPRDEYVKRLNECDVGVFYNNRQQGMGNISILLGLGKKVYLREGTSMWNSYCHKGYVIFSTSQIEKSAFEDFAAFDLGCRAVNEQIADKLSDDKWAIEKWQRVLDD